MMDDIYINIVKALEKNEKTALATLINREGSAPRAVGAKLLVNEDGTFSGSIGGGRVEAEVCHEAQKVIDKEERRILHFELTSEQLAEGGMICGGDIDVFLEPIRKEFLNIYKEVVKLRQKGGSAILATLISLDGNFLTEKGSKIFIKNTGETIGTLLGGASMEKEILKKGELLFQEKKPKVFLFHSENREIQILWEPIFSEPTVYLFGGGHISEKVAPLAMKVHFKVVVLDDREMFANRERFPEADEVIVLDFEKSFDQLKIDDSSYIVIVTRGHLYDGFVLDQAVRSNARYIGMIGSKKKIQTLYQSLIEKGVEKETLDRVHAPIGIDINSETPEEIAVSIVAELIKVRGEQSNKMNSTI
jgi:xanthine dehydrogenase accessory factor